MKKTTRFLSLILSCVMLFCFLPQSVLAQVGEALSGDEADATTEASVSGSSSSEVYVLGEVIEERTETTKTFRMSDGTFYVADYEKAVHYVNENGELTDYDNTLYFSSADVSAEEDFAGYENKESDLKIKLANNSNSNNLLKIQKDNYKISLHLVGANKSKAVSIYDADEKPEGNTIDSASTLNRLASGAIYKDILPSTDLEYIIIGGKVKENIIVKEKQESYSYTFELKLNGLVPVLLENGSIALNDEDTGETQLIIPAGYMYDSNGKSSYDVDYSIVHKNGKKYTLTITPDSEWMNDAERVFPITIDPTILGFQNGSDTSDAPIWESLAAYNSYLDSRMTVGYEAGFHMHALFRAINLPALPKSAAIVSAQLSIQQTTTNSGGATIGVYAVKSDWTSSGVTWNTRPSYDTSPLDYITLTSSTDGDRVEFDVTRLVQSWYEGEPNYGMALAPISGSAFGQVTFRSSDSSIKPLLNIHYRDTKGLESIWTYSSHGAGIAGTGYVNGFNGNLVFVHNDMNTEGSIIPIEVSHVYNSYLAGLNFTANSSNVNAPITANFNSMLVGKGWKLSIQETLTSVTIDSTVYYVYNDADGTELYFLADANGKFVSEDGYGLTVTVNSDGTKSLTDDYGNVKLFDSSGRLIRITDVHGNKKNINYSSNRISSVTYTPANTSSAITQLTFAYNSSGYLQTITNAYNTADYVSFTYSSEGYLTGVSYSLGGSSTYTYNSNGTLASAKDNDTGYTIAYTYSTYLNTNHVLRVTEKVGSATGQTIGYFYRDKFFAVNTRGLDNAYDTPDDIMYITLFDNFGRAVRNYATNATETQIYDTAYVDYTDFVSGSKANHKVTTDSVIGNTSFNYLSYGSFEQDTNWTPSYTGNGYSGATTDAKHLYGNKSLRLTSSGTSGSAKYTQSITIPAIGEYTFSIYVKAGNISSSGGGAYITLGGDSSEKLTGTTSLSVQDGWQRISVTKDFTSTGTYTAEVVLANATGTAYFDCGQVEFGSGASSVNLLQNGTKLENYWTGSEITSLSIGFANKITGSVNAQKSAYQTVNVNASIGQKFLLSGRAQASSAGLTDNRTFGLKAVLTYSNGTTEEHYVSFDQNITNWQYTSLVIIPKSTNTSLKVSTVTVYVVYDYNSGTMNFDDVFLAVSSAQTYSYDANTGNLKTASDAYGNQNSAEYTNNVDVKSITTVSGENYNYTYRTSNGVSTHQVSTATRNSRGVTQTLTYGYDNYGNTTSSTMTASGESAKISSSVGYTEYGNYIFKTIDELGNATNYSYNSLTKLLEYVENANSKRTAYIYDTRQRISKVYLDSDEDGIADVSDPQVDYVYTNNRLTGISTAKTDYTLTYDVWGNVTKIMAGGNTLATYTYAANNGKLLKLTYGNGDYESYTYDHLDRLVTVEYNEYIMYDVGYDGNGQIAHVLDNDTFHFYTYDIYGRLVTARQYNDSISELKISVANGYDSLGRPSGTTYLVNGVERTYQITYCDSSNLVDKIALPANTTVDYEYDGFDRLIGSEVILSSSRSVAELYKYYTYTSNGSTYATNLVSELTLTYDYDTSTDAVNISTTYSYTYDNLGNILTVSKDGTLIESYEYDSLNQLVRENNLNGNFTVLYGYDSAGNLMYKNKLAYTTASTNSIINAVGTITSYTYSSSAWGDMLTNYGGTSIAYDEIGNPTNWRNASLLNWNGRTLKSITLTNGSILSFEYNTAGIRTQKMVGSSGTTITYDYILDGTNIVAQIGSDGTRIEYLYDEKGSVIGCIYGGLGYYYRKNLQGDIVSIASHTGEIVVEYTYDAWGNILSITGSKSSGLGQINSFRYRGYFYDTETGLYYLNSRYYDPTVGRFISPDDSAVLTATPTALTDKNLYAYCDNNPVVRTDNGGQFWDTLFDVVSLVASVADVISDPTNVGAWVGLACDVVDVAIPFVGGFGEAYRIVNASIGVADTLDDVHDAKKATQRALESIENASKTLNRGSNTVYISYKGDTLEYVGITNDFGRRKTEWAGIRNIVEFVPGLDRKSARFVEQIVIDTFGMAKNGGDLSNKINSISIRNSIYEEYLEFAGRIK